MLSRVPILFQEALNVDDLGFLSDLRPKGMTGPHLDLRVYLGNQRNVSAGAQALTCVGSEETKGIQALGRCPGPVACLA